jgi:tetratricopeptide (TPR) repeat protein/transcriptional regulator with XRE-family HTH domain
MFDRLVAGHRRHLGLTQEELAEKTGLGVRSIRDLERGRVRVPRSATVRLLAEAFRLEGIDLARFHAAGGWSRPAEEDARRYPVPAQLPRDVPSFCGREQELRWLDAAVDGRTGDAGGPSAAVVVGGPAGVGKSALVVHWAHRVSHRFPDGQMYVDLQGHAGPGKGPLSPADTLVLLLRGLGVPPDRMPESEQERAGLYRTLLSARRLLILVDDAHSAAQVRPLLPAASASLLVVTSRFRLQSLVALHHARLLTLDVLTKGEADLLLRQVLGEEQPALVAELARLCAYLPLALRIAAARVVGPPRMSLARYLDELSADRLDALTLDSEPQTAVTTALNLSYAALEPGARRMFRLMGAWSGPDLGTQALAALVDLDARHAERLLRQLTAAHLVEQPTFGRFRFHGLLHAYAARLCREEDHPADTDRALRRLLSFYQQGVFAAASFYAPPARHLDRDPPDPTVAPAGFTNQAGSGAWLAAEAANLAATCEHASRHGPYRLAWQVAEALRTYFWLTHEAATWLSITASGVRAAVAAGDLAAEAVMRNVMGVARWSVGHYRPAIEEFERALTIDERLGASQRMAGVLGNLGGVYREVGDLRRCLEFSSRSCELFEKLAVPLGEANGRINLGGACEPLGRLDEMLRHANRALDLYRELGNLDGQGSSLLLIASALRQLDRDREAVEAGMRALDLFERIGSRRGTSCAQQVIAVAQLATGDLAGARQNAERAVSTARRADMPMQQADATSVLAQVEEASGRYRRARQLYSGAVAAARAAKVPEVELTALLGRASTLLRLNLPELADDDITEVLASAGEHGYPVIEARALTLAARTELARGNRAGARSRAARAVEILTPTGGTAWIGPARDLLTDLDGDR